ncbi:hypothetical protein MRX96_031884 [Rhipicephalus microplus]
MRREMTHFNSTQRHGLNLTLDATTAAQTKGKHPEHSRNETFHYEREGTLLGTSREVQRESFDRPTGRFPKEPLFAALCPARKEVAVTPRPVSCPVCGDSCDARRPRGAAPGRRHSEGVAYCSCVH